MENITGPGEIKRVLTALTQSRINAGCAVSDLQGIIQEANTGLAELLHTRVENLTGTSIWVHDMEMKAQQFDFFRDQLRPGNVTTRDTVIERRDISQFPARVSTTRFSVENMDFLLWIVSEQYSSTEQAPSALRQFVSLLTRMSGQGPMMSRN